MLKLITNNKEFLLHPCIILAASQFLEADFHGYKVNGKGEIFSKKNGKKLKTSKNYRNGGRFDLKLNLYIEEKRRTLVVQRIMCHVFYGMPLSSPLQANHLNRDTTNNNLWNIETSTPSQNQKHWREDEKTKRIRAY